jgi:nitroreductase
MKGVKEGVQMGVGDCIQSRRSVRGYIDKPVPPEVLEQVFILAQHAPSNCNVQPWRVFVASGAVRDRIREGLLRNVAEGVEPNPDFEYTPRFEGEYRKLQVECAVAMYSAMNITKEDHEGRARAALRNFELFDAPHVAFICMEKHFPTTVAVDVGIYAQTLMLAMTAHGIGCCAQGSMRTYPDVPRAEFGFSENLGVLFGISFGYEDPDVPANATRTTRNTLDGNVTFKA